MQAPVKIVKIQDLPPVTNKWRNKPEKRNTADDWKRKKCTHYYKDENCKCNVLCYLENVEANTYAHPNSFYGAFVEAYNFHEDVVLSPDDVWLVICFQFSKYVNDNSEKMRDLFVTHAGKKKLSVTTGNETKESEWDEFFDLMISAIKKNTREGVVESLISDFSTTKRVESLISVATIMDTMKQYFDYGRMIPCCGIRSIHFLGTEEDWKRVISRTQALERYAVNEVWSNYIKNLVPILTQFLNTYNGKVDVEFWNKMANITHGRLGSGSTTYVSGWILHFFGIYKQVESDEIKGYNFDFPVEIDNKLTGEQKTVSLVGGFGGVNVTDGAYRPQLSMIVFHDGNMKKL